MFNLFLPLNTHDDGARSVHPCYASTGMCQEKTPFFGLNPSKKTPDNVFVISSSKFFTFSIRATSEAPHIL